MRSRIEKWIRYYFGISRTEANGVIILVLIMAVLTFLPLIVNYLSHRNSGDSDEQQRLDSLTALLNQNLIPINREEIPASEDSFSYFSFDPNTAGREDLLELGLGAELSNRIIKYRESGGRFYRKEDLKKIYGLTTEKYDQLHPYISIEDAEMSISDKKFPLQEENRILDFSSKSDEIVLFDINKADSSELIFVDGVGKVLSSRIVRFRENLGGFVTIAQLQEVYGLEQYAFENLNESAFIEDNFRPRIIPINSWPADSLARHPYIDFNTARVIVAYRHQHGNYQKSSDLLQVLVLNKDWVERITPYLEF